MSGTTGLGLVLIPALQPATSLLGAFANVPPAQLSAWLLQAQNALNSLTCGAQVVTVSYGEGSGQKSVTYQKTSEQALRRHIREMQILLGQRPRVHAIRVI
jgi:hypothetical protein